MMVLLDGLMGEGGAARVLSGACPHLGPGLMALLLVLVVLVLAWVVLQVWVVRC